MCLCAVCLCVCVCLQFVNAEGEGHTKDKKGVSRVASTAAKSENVSRPNTRGRAASAAPGADSLPRVNSRDNAKSGNRSNHGPRSARVAGCAFGSPKSSSRRTSGRSRGEAHLSARVSGARFGVGPDFCELSDEEFMGVALPFALSAGCQGNGDKERRFTCEVCGKGYVDATSLDFHALLGCTFSRQTTSRSRHGVATLPCMSHYSLQEVSCSESPQEGVEEEEAEDMDIDTMSRCDDSFEEGSGVPEEVCEEEVQGQALVELLLELKLQQELQQQLQLQQHLQQRQQQEEALAAAEEVRLAALCQELQQELQQQRQLQIHLQQQAHPEEGGMTQSHVRTVETTNEEEEEEEDERWKNALEQTLLWEKVAAAEAAPAAEEEVHFQARIDLRKAQVKDLKSKP